MDSKRSMQQCLTFINDAKREIETVGRQETNQSVKSEIDQAYKSLNDSWNHCNSALQKIMY